MLNKFLIILATLLFALPGYSGERPVWIEADGDAYQRETETPKEVIDRARRKAESQAIEKAKGVFLKSHTIVSNYQIVEDLIYTSVRGKIERTDVIKAEWDREDRNLYKVKIRALIEPIYPEKGEGISVNLSLSKTNLKENEDVKIFYQADKDCYVYLFSVAADGSVTILLPNSINLENHVEANKAYVFPQEDGNIHLKAKFLPDFKYRIAEERIKIIATKNREDLLSLGFQKGILRVYDAKSTGLISDLVKRLSLIEPSEWAEATTAYQISR